MKLDLPAFKRCCFCIPLRYGLLACAYIRLVFVLGMFSFAVYFFVHYTRELTTDIIIIKSLFILLLVVDTCVTILFLIGGHQKTPKLLRVTFIYNLVLLGIFTLFFTWAIGSDLYNIESLSGLFGYTHYISILQMDILMGIMFVGMQVYIILLIRSEIEKLKNSANCRFDNLAAEAQCTVENGT